MSLTNPNKVVTEERLSAFYQDILPYLGGMPEILANKFSRSDIYSTTERMIGQAPDMKPLYMKVFSIEIPSGSTYNFVFSQQIADLGDIIFCDVDLQVTPLEGVNAYMFNGDRMQSSSGSSVLTYTDNYLGASTSSGQERIFTFSNTWTRKGNAYIIVKYTKASDNEEVIGVDTDYSTTEKIVGTDTDGNYIYQRTWTNLTTPASSGNGTILTLSNVNILKSSGYVTNGNNRYEFPWYLASDNYCYIWTSGNGTSSVGIRCSIGGSSSFLNKPITITLQYTKTS